MAHQHAPQPSPAPRRLPELARATPPHHLHLLQRLAGNAAVSGVVTAQRALNKHEPAGRVLYWISGDAVRKVVVVRPYDATTRTYGVRPADVPEGATHDVPRRDLAFSAESAARKLGRRGTGKGTDDRKVPGRAAEGPKQAPRRATAAGTNLRDVARGGLRERRARASEQATVLATWFAAQHTPPDERLRPPELPTARAGPRHVRLLGLPEDRLPAPEAGMSSDRSVTAYARAAAEAALRHQDSEGFVTELVAIARTSLVDAGGVPWLGLDTPHGGFGSGEFERKSWRMVISIKPGPLPTGAVLTHLVRTVFHEARHCEQISTTVHNLLRLDVESRTINGLTGVPLDVIGEFSPDDRRPLLDTSDGSARLWLAAYLPVVRQWLAGTVSAHKTLSELTSGHTLTGWRELGIGQLLDQVAPDYRRATGNTRLDPAVPAAVAMWLTTRRTQLVEAWDACRQAVPQTTRYTVLKEWTPENRPAFAAFDHLYHVLSTIYREEPMEWDARVVGKRASRAFKALRAETGAGRSG